MLFIISKYLQNLILIRYIQSYISNPIIIILIKFLYFAIYNGTWGSIPVLYQTCSYPEESINIFSGIIHIIYWISSFFSIATYFILYNTFKNFVIFYIYGIFGLISGIFTFLFVPDFQNIHKENIYKLYKKSLHYNL